MIQQKKFIIEDKKKLHTGVSFLIKYRFYGVLNTVLDK